MIRMYEYEPRVDDQGNAVTTYRDFQSYLFSYPYGFIWDFAADKVTIYGTAYRISSLQLVPVVNQVTCLCLCGGNGNGNSGGTGTKVNTDESLHGEGSQANPLGVQPSKKAGNRLQILEDGCYVGSEPLPYNPPAVVLSSSVEPGEYLKGKPLTGMVLTVRVTAGSESIRDVRIHDGTKTFHVFGNIPAGTHTYTFPLTTSLDDDTSFSASVSDGMDYFSNTLAYKFVLPVFGGIAGTMEVTSIEILAGSSFQVKGSSFDHIYESFSQQHLWMACPESRVIKIIMDENGFPVTAAFRKTPVKLTLADQEYHYTLYVFDTPATGENYKITFNS